MLRKTPRTRAAAVVEGIASMRPQRNAAENVVDRLEIADRAERASMRPQRNAAENH